MRISFRTVVILDWVGEEHTVANIAVAKPLSLAVNMSAMTPPELVRGELPMVPAKKRRMMSD